MTSIASSKKKQQKSVCFDLGPWWLKLESRARFRSSCFSHVTITFTAGMSYSSIHISRSTLSSTLNMGIDNREEIGKYPLVIRLMKDIFQAKPTTTK